MTAPIVSLANDSIIVVPTASLQQRRHGKKRSRSPKKLLSKLLFRRPRQHVKSTTFLMADDDHPEEDSTTMQQDITAQSMTAGEEDDVLQFKMDLLFASSSPSSDDDEATVPTTTIIRATEVQDAISPSTQSFAICKTSKAVRFTAAPPTIMPSVSVSTPATWYSEGEILVLKQQFHDLLKTLRVDYKHSVLIKQSSGNDETTTHYCWMGHFRRVYQAMCQTNTSPQEQRPITAGLQDHDVGVVVGMERWAVPGILPDVRMRRQQLFRTARQDLHLNEVAQQCRTISLPSRLYARHVADQVALMVIGEDE